MYQSILTLIHVNLAYTIHFVKNYTVLKNISIYIRHFERWPLLSMKRDSYYVIGCQGNAVVT